MKLLKLFRMPFIGIILGIAIIVGSLATGVYFYQRARTAEAIIKDPQKLGKEEGKRLIESLKKLMEIPADEEPTIATVADASKLKDQAFFAKSQNGDKVIVFTKAKKAILYRPSTNKIIDVAPVSIGDGQIQPDASQNPASQGLPESSVNKPMPPVAAVSGTVVILNGTTSTGITKKVEDQLRSAFPTVIMMERDNAKGKAYAKTLVIDAKGAKQELARSIAESLGASLSAFPEGEATPTADIVVIVGEDKK